MQSRKRCGSILRNKGRIWFLLPGVLGVAVFVFVPFADVVKRSFFTSMSGQFAGIRNYTSVFENEAFRLAAYNTLRFMAVSIPLLICGSLGLALLLYTFPNLESIKLLYLLPMAMPAATIVLVWRLIFAQQGLLNSLLGTHTAFLEKGASFFVLCITYLWKNTGYTVILWLAALKAVPAGILEAARVDGAGKCRIFFQIMLPGLKGSLYTITVLSVLNGFKVFREAYLINGAYPPEDSYLLQHVFQNWYTRLDFDKMAAGAVLAAAVLGGLAVLLKRLWDRSGTV